MLSLYIVTMMLVFRIVPFFSLHEIWADVLPFSPVITYGIHRTHITVNLFSVLIELQIIDLTGSEEGGEAFSCQIHFASHKFTQLVENACRKMLLKDARFFFSLSAI